MVLWCMYHGFMQIIYIYIYIKNQRPIKLKRKIKEKKMVGVAQKKIKRKYGQFCPNIFVHFSLPFSL